MQNGNWSLEQAGDQTGRRAIVTGGNSGIGYETSLALAELGAQVILAVRSPDKGEAAAQAIRQRHPKAQVEVRRLDLADLESIHQFAQEFKRDYGKLDLLINNAGVMALPKRTTKDGFEMQFGTNHLGHFALTGLLLDLLLTTPGSRVVTVSSMVHTRGRMNFNDLMGEQSYERSTAYGQSKLANLLFAYELQRKLEAIHAGTISLAAHPGYAATNLQSAGPEMEGSQARLLIMQVANKLFAQSAAMGALPTLYAALNPNLQGGEYIGPNGFMGIRGQPALAESSPASHDRQAAQRLWQVSEELTGVQYTALEGAAQTQTG